MTTIRCCMTPIVLLAVILSAHAEEADIDRGAELLMPFKQSLQSALREGLAESPVHAIGVCKVQAPEIAARFSLDGVRVGRSSHRLRNPANTAPDWVGPVLNQYLANNALREPQAVELPGNHTGYVEPIVLQPMCVTCHGETLAPDVASRIHELYPNDQATGFVVGDLRGVFWIEFSKSEL